MQVSHTNARGALRQMAKQYSKDNLRRKVSKRLKTARVDLKLTQEGVAQLFNPPLSRTAITQWEIGDTLPDMDRLAVLSKAYGVSLDALVFGPDGSPAAVEDLTPSAVRVARNWMALHPKQQDLIAALLSTMK